MADAERKQAVFFGELLMRLEALGFEPLVQARKLTVRYTGGEANAAVALANWGIGTWLVSAVPANEIGDACVNTFRGLGANVDYVLRTGSRLGLFFLESGAAQRASKVIYDRAGSAFCELRPGQIPWAEVFRGKHWFHITGTAAALTAESAEVAIEACREARAAGITVSVDPNFRQALWRWDPALSPVELAGRTLKRMLPHVNVLITNPDQAVELFGVGRAGVGRKGSGRIVERCARMGRELATRFGVEKVGFTVRGSLSASHNRWGAVVCDARSGRSACAPRSRQGYSPYDITPIVDRVGTGDAFAAGLIRGLLLGKSLEETVAFAAAASCLKHAVPGDFGTSSEADVEALARGDALGRIRR